MTSTTENIGPRIADLRRDRGMSQRDLAAAVGRSEGWVSQVERGVQPVHRVPVLQLLATALGVRVEDLHPQAKAGSTKEKQDSTPQPLKSNDLDAIRLMMSGHPAIDAVLLAEDDLPAVTSPNGSPERLQKLVDEAWTLVHANRFADLTDLLEKLIPALEKATRASSSRNTPALNRLKCRAYQVASAAFARQDEPDAAWLAADRSMAAAELSDDPLEVAAGHFRLAHAFLRAKRIEQAERVAQVAIDTLKLRNEHRNEPHVTALLGALHLVYAVVSARSDNRERAKASLAVAESLAEEVGDDRNDFNTEFGTTNVLLHRVSIAVELGDAGEALDIASKVDSQKLSTERRARFLIDVAAAHTQRQRQHPALEAVLKAERLSAEFVLQHHYARDVIRKMLRLEPKNVPQKLHELARRANIH